MVMTNKFHLPCSLLIVHPSVPSMLVVGTNWRLPSFNTEETILKISQISSDFRPISSIARWNKKQTFIFIILEAQVPRWWQCIVEIINNIPSPNLKRQTISKINYGLCVKIKKRTVAKTTSYHKWSWRNGWKKQTRIDGPRKCTYRGWGIILHNITGGEF